MKNLFTLSIVVVLVLSFVSCTDNDEITTTDGQVIKLQDLSAVDKGSKKNDYTEE